jgi:hypothetical protein
VHQMEISDQEEMENQCERPSGSSHVEVGGGAALNLENNLWN